MGILPSKAPIVPRSFPLFQAACHVEINERGKLDAANNTTMDSSFLMCMFFVCVFFFFL